MINQKKKKKINPKGGSDGVTSRRLPPDVSTSDAMHAARVASLHPATWGRPRGGRTTAPKPRVARSLRAASAAPSALVSSPSPTPSTSTAPSGWDARVGKTFDWRRQWYPVAWERDLPAGVPTKVTLFDEDFVVVRGRARDNKLTYADGVHDFDEPIALVDKCPHRLAALSEGRAVFTPQASDDAGAGTGTGASIHVQCSYHGWTFDGATAGAYTRPLVHVSSQRKHVLCDTMVGVSDRNGSV